MEDHTVFMCIEGAFPDKHLRVGNLVYRMCCATFHLLRQFWPPLVGEA